VGASQGVSRRVRSGLCRVGIMIGTWSTWFAHAGEAVALAGLVNLDFAELAKEIHYDRSGLRLTFDLAKRAPPSEAG
jgi:hypothetical protein